MVLVNKVEEMVQGHHRTNPVKRKPKNKIPSQVLKGTKKKPEEEKPAWVKLPPREERNAGRSKANNGSQGVPPGSARNSLCDCEAKC